MKNSKLLIVALTLIGATSFWLLHQKKEWDISNRISGDSHIERGQTEEDIDSTRKESSPKISSRSPIRIIEKNRSNASTFDQNNLVDIRLLPPEIVYDKYLPEAEQGSSNSQLYVSIILERCSMQSIRDIEKINELEEKNEVPKDFIDHLRNVYFECKELYSRLENFDLNQLRQAWLQKSADMGNPVAKLKILLDQPGNPNKEDVLPLLYESIDISKENPIFREIAFKSAQKYYAKFIEPLVFSFEEAMKTGDFRRSVDRDAWDFLACESSVTCDEIKFLRAFKEHFSNNEVDEMLARANEITNAIDERRWDVLDLEDTITLSK